MVSGVVAYVPNNRGGCVPLVGNLFLLAVAGAVKSVRGRGLFNDV